jgi:hypothetical protein
MLKMKYPILRDYQEEDICNSILPSNVVLQHGENKNLQIHNDLPIKDQAVYELYRRFEVAGSTWSHF